MLRHICVLLKPQVSILLCHFTVYMLQNTSLKDCGFTWMTLQLAKTFNLSASLICSIGKYLSENYCMG